MEGAAGETVEEHLRVEFDRRLKLEFHGSCITSDAGLLAFRELDEALGLTEMAGQALDDVRTGRNGRHTLLAQFRQAVFGRLAGYEDVNDADRLGRDPAMRWIDGGRAVTKEAASTSRMGRIETGTLTSEANLAALADLSGRGASATMRIGPMMSQMRPAGAGAAPESALSVAESLDTIFPHAFGRSMLHLQRGR